MASLAMRSALPLRTARLVAPSAAAAARSLTTSPPRHQDVSSSGGAEQQSGQEGQQPKKRTSMLKSLLHGSDQAKSEGDTLQSHSTTVGRSKYIHEVQRHAVLPQAVDEYKELIGTYFGKIAEHSHLNTRLMGSFEVVVGDLDTFVHIWEFEGYAGYDFASNRIRAHPEYKEYLSKIRPMLQSRSSQLCREFAFWPCSGPRESGGIYEMRSYALKPGTLLEWEVEWRRGLEARRKFVEPIGAWFSQVGKLHQVHHMWQYGSMDERLKKREEAWQVDTWGKTVSKTVKLCDSMDANILLPLPFSPLR